MRNFDRQLFRFTLVLALGAGLAALAAQPSKPKIVAVEKPAPIILAAAYENVRPSASDAAVGARIDQCSLNPRDYADSRPIGDKADKGLRKRKVVVCG
jgi:hypothetical protein